MNDQTLVQALRQQDPAAFREAYESFAPTLWRFVCTRVGGDAHIAEDIVSESFLALVKAAGKDNANNEIENIAAWLRRVAVNKVTDYYRAAGRVRQLIDDAQHEKKPDPHKYNPARDLDHLAEQEELRTVMDEISEQHRLALEWKYIDKISVRDMADRWETTEKAVESILFRARREFRERFERFEKLLENPLLAGKPPNATSPGEGSSSTATSNTYIKPVNPGPSSNLASNT